ncbi:hypothetical protein CDD81_3302 [Ophiocordyceps australis]|uniref:Myb-like domain-containing protein n=1 Tax=Ophiocordyceps australis TaxID=1399860 RepID=A0A2C5YE68_9HYPO|nr:hypothetical protein CDD81_3302 [Ophiocordyceps australis]
MDLFLEFKIGSWLQSECFDTGCGLFSCFLALSYHLYLAFFSSLSHFLPQTSCQFRPAQQTDTEKKTLFATKPWSTFSDIVILLRLEQSRTMPPKASASGGESSNLTEGEMRFIKALFDNLKSKPDADWDGIANDLGLKTPKYAKDRFRQMSKLHNWGECGSVSASPSKRSAEEPTGPDSPIKKTRAKIGLRARNTPKKKVARQSKNKHSSDADESNEAVPDSGGEQDATAEETCA